MSDILRSSDDDVSSLDEELDSVAYKMQHAQRCVREMLQSKVFIGTYREKELCESIMSYK